MRRGERLWKLKGEWWNVNVIGCNSLSDLCNLGNQEGVGVRSGRRWTTTVWCVAYLIWSNRNKLVFSNKKTLLKDELFNFQLKTLECVNRRNKEIAVDWHFLFGLVRVEAAGLDRLLIVVLGILFGGFSVFFGCWAGAGVMLAAGLHLITPQWV
ncbi:hypothetical protein OSB04_010641 [Centaurea solstitialis]|uniref:Transmembrane protein n=1 Tax=Centaurea solstitialis TaxID=347529 RepID=A0AA38WC61_9ASTR|nr:hypothetical protein OSB04_010641 [Centaurea solstitialis]